MLSVAVMTTRGSQGGLIVNLVSRDGTVDVPRAPLSDVHELPELLSASLASVAARALYDDAGITIDAASLANPALFAAVAVVECALLVYVSRLPPSEAMEWTPFVFKRRLALMQVMDGARASRLADALVQVPCRKLLGEATADTRPLPRLAPGLADALNTCAPLRAALLEAAIRFEEAQFVRCKALAAADALAKKTTILAIAHRQLDEVPLLQLKAEGEAAALGGGGALGADSSVGGSSVPRGRWPRIVL